MRLVCGVFLVVSCALALDKNSIRCLPLNRAGKPTIVAVGDLYDATTNQSLGLMCLSNAIHEDCTLYQNEDACKLSVSTRYISINSSMTCSQLLAAMRGTEATLTASALCSPRSPQPTNNPPSEQSSLASYIGIGVGSFVFGCVIVYLIYRNQAARLRRQHATELVFGELKSETSRRGGHILSSRTPRDVYVSQPTYRTNQRSGLFAPPVNVEVDEIVGFHLDMGDLDLWRVDENDLTSHELIAKNANGEIWVGDYRGRIVAVKKCGEAGRTAQDVQKFIDEIKLFTKLDSPYITEFIGVSWTRPREIELVMEFMPNGDLRKYLDSTKNVPGAFPWPEKINIMLDIVAGLTYLHSVDIIHRDLKSKNVLLSESMAAKLTDFGVSKEITSGIMTQGVGTHRWTAPELIAGEHYTVAADIYSFGVLISELDTHDIPYADYRNEKNLPLSDFQIMTLVRKGSIQPHFTHGCPDWVYNLALQCISLDPSKRPKGPEIAHILRQELKSTFNSPSFLS